MKEDLSTLSQNVEQAQALLETMKGVADQLKERAPAITQEFTDSDARLQENLAQVRTTLVNLDTEGQDAENHLVAQTTQTVQESVTSLLERYGTAREAISERFASLQTKLEALTNTVQEQTDLLNAAQQELQGVVEQSNADVQSYQSDLTEAFRNSAQEVETLRQKIRDAREDMAARSQELAENLESSYQESSDKIQTTTGEGFSQQSELFRDVMDELSEQLENEMTNLTDQIQQKIEQELTELIDLAINKVADAIRNVGDRIIQAKEASRKDRKEMEALMEHLDEITEPIIELVMRITEVPERLRDMLIPG